MVASFGGMPVPLLDVFFSIMLFYGCGNIFDFRYAFKGIYIADPVCQSTVKRIFSRYIFGSAVAYAAIPHRHKATAFCHKPAALFGTDMAVVGFGFLFPVVIFVDNVVRSFD